MSNSKESEIGNYSILGGGFNPNVDGRDQKQTSETPQSIFEGGSIFDAAREFARTPTSDFNGIYTPNNYRIRFQGNYGLGFDTLFDRKLDYFASRVNLPGKNIESTGLRIYGPEREMPNGVSYSGDITANFIVSQDFFLYKWFVQWMNRIVGETTSNLSYYENFVSRMLISPVVTGADNKRDETPIVFVIEDVWPKTISQMELSNANRNSVLEFTVNFSFRKWHYIAFDKQIVAPPPPPPTDEEANAAYDEYLSETATFLRNNELYARRSDESNADVYRILNPRQDQTLFEGNERFTNGNLPTPVFDFTRGSAAAAGETEPQQLTDLERLLQ